MRADDAVAPGAKAVAVILDVGARSYLHPDLQCLPVFDDAFEDTIAIRGVGDLTGRMKRAGLLHFFPSSNVGEKFSADFDGFGHGDSAVGENRQGCKSRFRDL